MAVLGPNYPISSTNTLIGLYSNPITARPPEYPYYDGLTLRDASARQKIRVELLSNVGNAVAKLGYGVWVKRVGNPSGDFWLEWGFSADDSTPPASFTASGTPIACSGVSADAYEYYYFSDASIPVADPSKQYIWMVLNGDFTVSATDYMVVASSTGLVGDSFQQWNGSAWSSSGSSQEVNGVSYPIVNDQFNVGQVLYIDESQRASSLKVKLERTGSPTGTVWVEILPVRDYNGPVAFWEPEYADTYYDTLLATYVTEPNRDIIASSDRINLSSIPTSAAEVSFEFTLSPELQFGAHYAFILRTDATLDAVDNLSIAVDTTTPSYTEGTILFQRTSDHLAGGEYRIGFSAIGFELYLVEQESFVERLTALGDPPASCNDLRGYLTDVVNVLKGYFPTVLPEPYGGTGEASYAKGDILYAPEANNLARLPIGSTAGMALTVSDTGLPEWAQNGGQVLEKVYNDSGIQLDPGDTVIWNSTEVTPAGAVTYTSTPHLHDLQFCGVVVEPIPAGGYGFVCTQGIVNVRISGTVASGEYLGLSYTARRASGQTTHPGPMRAIYSGTDGQLLAVYLDTGRADGSPTGATMVWWTATPPPGWLFCTGQAVSRAAYAKLFALVGTTFGVGDGSTTFNLPDLRTRTVIGLDSGAGRGTTIVADTIGAVGGEEQHTTTLNETPNHRHFMGYTADDGTGNFGPAGISGLLANTAGKNTSPVYSDYTGGGAAHNNMQPSIRGLWMIKVV